MGMHNEKQGFWIRSENCSEYLENWMKEWMKLFVSVSMIYIVAFLFVLLLPFLTAFLNGEDIANASFTPLNIMLDLTVGVIAVWGGRKIPKRIEEVRAEYALYTGYCATEVLLGEDDRIYGSTCEGELELRLDQIGDVRFMPNVPGTDKKTYVPNDILVITDIVGNEFFFYSFKNCKELKTVIDVRRKTDDNM